MDNIVPAALRIQTCPLRPTMNSRLLPSAALRTAIGCAITVVTTGVRVRSPGGTARAGNAQAASTAAAKGFERGSWCMRGLSAGPDATATRAAFYSKPSRNRRSAS